MKLGIVGLPNVGKSTLFNAITNAGAQSANYAFCTIEPNVGVVDVRMSASIGSQSSMSRQKQRTPRLNSSILRVWSKARPKAKG